MTVLFRQTLTEYGGVPEWPKGTDCKSAAYRFDGSNPSSPTTKSPTPSGVGLFMLWEADSKNWWLPYIAPTGTTAIESLVFSSANPVMILPPIGGVMTPPYNQHPQLTPSAYFPNIPLDKSDFHAIIHTVLFELPV